MKSESLGTGTTLRFTTCSRAETVGLGEALAAVLRAGDAVAMDGDLGAGKTAMTEGIARGLGVSGPVSSPTFTLLIEHGAGPRGLALHHFDAYRLQGSAEFLSLGFDEVVGSGGVSVVEWAERVRAGLPENPILVVATRKDDVGEDARRIDVAFPEGREEDAAKMSRLVSARGRTGEESST